MNEEQKQLLKETTAKKKYFKFEKDKRVVVGLHNWKLAKKEVDSKYGEGKQEKTEFSSLVLTNSEEGVKEEEFSTISVRFMEAVEQYILDKEPDKDIVWLSVKKLGEGTSVNYDVENVEDPKAKVD